jgi:methionyl aminopeptidase
VKASTLVKSRKEIGYLREAGRAARLALDAALGAVKPGVTTADVDEVTERTIRALGATPEFKGYRGYPASICISVNEEVVHGIPGRRVIREGDVVSVDVGARLHGWVGDNAATVIVGPAAPEADRLSGVGRECLERAIEQCVPGKRLSDIGRAVQGHAESRGFGVVRDLTGHGIGSKMHEEPHVYNYVDAETLRHDRVLEEGMCLAIEPMLVAGRVAVKTLADGWTVVTKDGSLAVHWEDVVAVTADGPVVLTRP